MKIFKELIQEAKNLIEQAAQVQDVTLDLNEHERQDLLDLITEKLSILASSPAVITQTPL